MDADVKKEFNRLKRLVKGMDAKPKGAITPLLENTAWLKVKLDDIRDELGYESATVTYDNGGGQTGVRKNPGFEMYSTLFSQYRAAIKQICELLPEGDEQDELTSWLTKQ